MNIKTQTTDNADLKKQIEDLLAANATLKANQPKPRAISWKVSEKGACSVYGLGRFPVTLYAGQWERLLGKADEIKQFLKDNTDTLTTK